MRMQKSINTHVYAKKYHNTYVCKNIIAHVYALKVHVLLKDLQKNLHMCIQKVIKHICNKV